jgi:hypothetical protein
MVIRQEYSYLAQLVRLSNAQARQNASYAVPKGRKGRLVLSRGRSEHAQIMIAG